MQIFSLKLVLLFAGIACYSSIYTIDILTIDGQNKSMQDFNQKKIMVIVLPATQNAQDSLFLRSIDSFSISHQNVSIIAVPSFEDGYDLANSASLRNFYQSLLADRVTLTKGMFTRKGSAQNQHELFAWLTHSEKNTHFNLDVEGPGQKFFINEGGNLYAVIGPNMPLWNRRIHGLTQQ
jgi:glutathione peroxidase